MNFEELNDTIPYVIGGKVKILRYSPYPHVTLAMPGRHAKDTVPKGGDFVVMVDDPMLTYNGRKTDGEHQFKHDDIFNDVQQRKRSLMKEYLQIVQGAAPLAVLNKDRNWEDTKDSCIDYYTFLCAVQCLAVAEHRRYAQYEAKFGGRFLPFRFAAGIDEGLWTPNDAIACAKRGRPGVELLEKTHGVPVLTKELMI